MRPACPFAIVNEIREIDQLTGLIRGKMNKSNAKETEKRLAYFTENADKMRYGLYSANGMFSGSGVIEAACKTIVGKRMKNAGMHWSKKNKALSLLDAPFIRANSILRPPEPFPSHTTMPRKNHHTPPPHADYIIQFRSY
jgi:hypothetical protein